MFALLPVEASLLGGALHTAGTGLLNVDIYGALVVCVGLAMEGDGG